MVCIEGNIGSGKSELLRRLAQNGFSTQQEPVERWSPFLDQVYNDGHGFVALQTRVTLDTGATPTAQIVERSPAFQMPVFVRAALQDGSIADYEEELLGDLHERVVEWRPRALVYLRCQPLKCRLRVRQRDRVEEGGLNL